MDKYQCLKLIRCQVFSPNCQKITWGHHGRCLMPLTPPVMGDIMETSDAPLTPPMLFFSKKKKYLSNQMHSFFPRTKITWGASWDIRHYPPFIHHPQHPSPAHQTHHHPPHHQPPSHHHPNPTTIHPTHPTTPTLPLPTPPIQPLPSHHHLPPTHRKSGALMPDISWAPPHSLPIQWTIKHNLLQTKPCVWCYIPQVWSLLRKDCCIL